MAAAAGGAVPFGTTRSRAPAFGAHVLRVGQRLGAHIASRGPSPQCPLTSARELGLQPAGAAWSWASCLRVTGLTATSAVAGLVGGKAACRPPATESPPGDKEGRHKIRHHFLLPASGALGHGSSQLGDG